MKDMLDLILEATLDQQAEVTVAAAVDTQTVVAADFRTAQVEAATFPTCPPCRPEAADRQEAVDHQAVDHQAADLQVADLPRRHQHQVKATRSG